MQLKVVKGGTQCPQNQAKSDQARLSNEPFMCRDDNKPVEKVAAASTRPGERRSATFPLMTHLLVHNVEVEITGASREALLNELHALADTRFGNHARKLRHTLAADGSFRVVSLPIREFLALLRALDHVLNTRAAALPLRRLRDLVSAAGIVYTIRPLGGRDVTFSSHSGPYVEGDRVVMECGDAIRVDHVEESGEPTRLLCSE